VNLFLSYTSDDREKLKPLLEGLHKLKYSVWLDQELSGGQQWWDAILQRIRESDAVLLAVSPALAESDACGREIDYARLVGKPILPVMIDAVRPEFLAPDLAALQIVDFSKPGGAGAFDLMGALQQLPPAKPVPDPLPEPPAVPVSYLSGLSQKIQSPAHLSLDEQLSIVAKLKMGITRPRERDSIIQLIAWFKLREDLYQATARELESIPIPDIKTTPAVAVQQSSQEITAAPPVAGFYTDPLRRHQMRFWSGSAWTGRIRNGAAEGFDGVPGSGTSSAYAAARPTAGNSNRTLWLVAAGVIGLLVLIGGGIGLANVLGNLANTPTTVASPTPLAVGDPCVVGRWVGDSSSFTLTSSNGPVTYVGGQGAVLTISADGTSILDYGASVPFLTSVSGSSIGLQFKGTVTSKVHATAPSTFVETIESQYVTYQFYLNGQPYSSSAEVPPFEASTGYRCSTSSLTETSPGASPTYTRR
jgi:hypothetical protein